MTTYDPYDHLIPCPDCEEPWCPKHQLHYADCDCPGVAGETECKGGCGEWFNVLDEAACPYCGWVPDRDVTSSEYALESLPITPAVERVLRDMAEDWRKYQIEGKR